MPLSRRYSPEFAPGEQSTVGMDFSAVVPPGVGLTAGTLAIFTHRANPIDDTSNWNVSHVAIRGRTLYATVSGGNDGQDYQLRWSATDTDGNIWPRTALLRCSLTS